MFLRVVHSSIDPAKIDDVLALKDDVIAATKKQAGFVSFQGGVSRATGAFITVSTWETEAAGRLPLPWTGCARAATRCPPAAGRSGAIRRARAGGRARA